MQFRFTPGKCNQLEVETESMKLKSSESDIKIHQAHSYLC